jgi:tetratricopeptide (TPR) repeat protein
MSSPPSADTGTTIGNLLFKLFEGWRATIETASGGFRVIVPRMSEGAMRVLTSEIQAQIPEAYSVRTSTSTGGGCVFEIGIDSSTTDNLARFFDAVRSLGFRDLEGFLASAASAASAGDAATQVQALSVLSLDLESRKEFDMARRALSLAGCLEPANVRIRFNHAVLLLKLGELAGAVRLFEEILALDPEFEPALHNLAAYHAQRGDRDKARSYLSRLVAAHPASATAQVLAGQIARDEGNLGQALEHFLRSVRIDPEIAEGHYWSALVLRELESKAEALEHWARYRALVRVVPEGRFLPVRVMIEGEPAGAVIVVDGTPVGPAPRAVMNLPPGRRRLGVAIAGSELTIDLVLEDAGNYGVRYDLTAGSITYRPTTVEIQVPDEDGADVPGPELARRVLARLDRPEELVGLTARQVFATILHECLKDGALSDAEKDLIFEVKQLLKIPADLHQQVFKEIQERLRSIPRADAAAEGELEPETLYRMLSRRAIEDGSLLSEENKLLESIGRLLSIPRPRRREIEREVQAELQSMSN